MDLTVHFHMRDIMDQSVHSVEFQDTASREARLSMTVGGEKKL